MEHSKAQLNIMNAMSALAEGRGSTGDQAASACITARALGAFSVTGIIYLEAA